MLLGIKNKKVVFLRHLLMAIFSFLLVYLFYLSYSSWGVKPALWPDWSAPHPYWRAWAHAAWVLLFLALILGPAAKLWHPLVRFLSWRRELGIWFAVMSAGHAYAIWDRWALWDVAGLFGIQYMEELGGYVLVRPEVGIMNMMMLMATPMIVLLVATSFDRAVSFLGISAWKWLHSSLIHAIFYILMLRGILYFFFFFQVSPPNWRVYPDIWFLYVFLGMGLFAVLLQAAAYAKTVLQQRSYGQKNSVFQVAAVVAIAILFAMPMVLATATVVYFDSRLIKEVPASIARQAQPAQNYSQTFYMVIHEPDRNIHIWARNIDSEPYFRQTVEKGGLIISHQIYRFGERTLYTKDVGQLTWAKTENVGPENIGISSIAAGPGMWAAQYGVGEHQIKVSEGTVLRVTIRSVGEAIADEVFIIPEGADPLPIAP